VVDTQYPHGPEILTCEVVRGLSLRVYIRAVNLAARYRINPCSKKDDALVREKQHKKIVGSATDVGDCLLYPTVLRYIRIRICLLDKKGAFMKTRFAVLLLAVGVIGLSLSGCGCFMQAQKGEAAPPPPQAAVHETVVIVASEPKAEEQVVAVAAAPTPQVVVLAFEDIHFDFDKATLKPEAQTILKRNIQILKENPKAQVRIAGYTSASGTDAYNQKLSERRANAVKGYLVSEGLIPSDRLSIIGFGKTDPAMHEAAPKDLYSAAAKANMRVLFEIVVQ
jgi:outer membrane protein OmpA-like peptidoglycan-associated protein